MDINAKGWRVLLGAFLLGFIGSGAYVLYRTVLAPAAATDLEIAGWLRIIYVLHLACWMLMGMAANYLWDLFRRGKSWEDILLRDLFIPFFVSPIVFFGIYSLWPGETPTFALCLIAFQNGFFWQVVFSKAGPISEQGAAAQRAEAETAKAQG
jgi:hypothetical protein